MTCAARDRWAARSCTGHLHQVVRGLFTSKPSNRRRASMEAGFLDPASLGATPPSISRTGDGHTATESATPGKALVRAVARGREDSPAGSAVLRKAARMKHTPFPMHKQWTRGRREDPRMRSPDARAACVGWLKMGPASAYNVSALCTLTCAAAFAPQGFGFSRGLPPRSHYAAGNGGGVKRVWVAGEKANRLANRPDRIRCDAMGSPRFPPPKRRVETDGMVWAGTRQDRPCRILSSAPAFARDSREGGLHRSFNVQ